MNPETLPRRIRQLPQDHRGYPIPWFVAIIDGKPDFRIMDGDKLIAAVRHNLCWVCGQGLGSIKAFVIGPMCAVNRVSAEPPGHRGCAEFSATTCPFLIDPEKTRAEGNVPEGAGSAGIMLKRNPGVTLLWLTKKYHVKRAPNGVLFDIGIPEETLWYKEGRPATHDEVLKSIHSGLPSLQKLADEDGDEAKLHLMEALKNAMKLIPTAPPR